MNGVHDCVYAYEVLEGVRHSLKSIEDEVYDRGLSDFGGGQIVASICGGLRSIVSDFARALI